MIPIFVTTWHRTKFLSRCLYRIKESTRIPNEITVWDNGSTPSEVSDILRLREVRALDNLVLWKSNTGCGFPKAAFHAMCPVTEEFYIVNDADVYAPLLDGDCWLTRMIKEMQTYEDIGVLAAQLPPQQFQNPYERRGNHFRCKAVGNTLKLVRRSAVPQDRIQPLIGTYSDDAEWSAMINDNGYKIAFMRDVWCLHAGQTVNWGYEASQINEDPRKAGYGEPFVYAHDPKTYIPTEAKWKLE